MCRLIYSFAVCISSREDSILKEINYYEILMMYSLSHCLSDCLWRKATSLNDITISYHLDQHASCMLGGFVLVMLIQAFSYECVPKY